MSTTTCVHIPESVTTEAGPALLERAALADRWPPTERSTLTAPSASPGHPGHPGFARGPAPSVRRVVRIPDPATGPTVVTAEWAKRHPWMPPAASTPTLVLPLAPGRTTPVPAAVPGGWTAPRPTRPGYASPCALPSPGTPRLAPWTRSATCRAW
jgi:hypothetical protein